MKLPAILVIVLLLPSVSVSQTDDLLLDFDVSAPVHGMEVEVGFGRKLWNSIGLIFAPDVVKREWPLYAYDPGRVLNDSDGPCQDGSRFAGLTVGHDVALITAQASGDSFSGYTGWRLRPQNAGGADSGTDAAFKFGDLCDTFRSKASQNKFTGKLALQPWMQPADPNLSATRSLKPLNEAVCSVRWVLLMEGTVQESE